jgi:hypothetical protein
MLFPWRFGAATVPAMTWQPWTLADFRRMKRNVERDLRERYAMELMFLAPEAVDAYLADESARYALAFLRVARPRWEA